MVDNNNNVMLDFIYDEIRGEKNGTIILISNENYGLADLDGNIIIIPQWLWMDNMFDGWALIYYEIERSSSDYAYSFIDSKGCGSLGLRIAFAFGECPTGAPLGSGPRAANP